MSADRNQLRRDGNGDLFWGDGANIQANRCVNTVEKMRRYTFLAQRLEDLHDLTFRTDHAHVAGARLHGPAQDAHIVAMAACDDHDVGRLVRVELLRSLIEIEGVNLAGGGEAFLGGVGGAVVSHHDVKSCARRSLTKA